MTREDQSQVNRETFEHVILKDPPIQPDQGVEKDLLISRPLSDVRSSVESVSIVEPRGELNSAGSLALNSADNSSFPGDSGVPAEPLISGVTESLAARYS